MERLTRVGSRSLAGLVASFVLLAASGARGEPGTPTGWLERPQLTGDWAGRRDALARRGIRPVARYTAGFWSNVRGGFRKKTRYEGFAEWFLHADLERLVGWRGGSFGIDWYSYHGGLPSEDVGLFDTQTISGWETETSVRFFEILLRQTWGDGRFVLKAGQLAADTDFFVSENATTLLNGTFGFLGLGRARALAPFYPLAAPGAYFRARTRDARWEAHMGVYTANPGDDRSDNFGFDWTFDNGAFFLGELRARLRPFGLPGSYAFGVAGTTAEVENFESLDTGDTVDGTVGLYGLLDQTLLEQTDAGPGLGIFLRSYGVPQEDRNVALWYVDFGLRLTRPFPGRDEDVFSLGFALLGFGDEYRDAARTEGLRVSRRESVLEVTYRLQVTGWLTLQPDLQFVFDPHFSRRDATVIGLRAVIEL